MRKLRVVVVSLFISMNLGCSDESNDVKQPGPNDGVQHELSQERGNVAPRGTILAIEKTGDYAREHIEGVLRSTKITGISAKMGASSFKIRYRTEGPKG